MVYFYNYVDFGANKMKNNMIICPFGINCTYKTHKKHQSNNVCYLYDIGKCTEKTKYYEGKQK